MSPFGEDFPWPRRRKKLVCPSSSPLQFFVITSVGLGVFCYVLYSDQADQYELGRRTKEQGSTSGAADGTDVKARKTKLKIYQAGHGNRRSGRTHARAELLFEKRR